MLVSPAGVEPALRGGGPSKKKQQIHDKKENDIDIVD